jgi:hypothetical protein
MSSVIAVPPSRVMTELRSLVAGAMSTPTTVAPSRCRTSADRGADPAGGPGHQRDLAGQRPLDVEDGRGDPGGMAADPDHLAAHVRGLGGEQEREGRAQRVLGALGDVDELRGPAAAADLLADRAGEALQRALGDALGVGRGGLGRSAQDDDARVGGQRPHDRREELLQCTEPRDVGDPDASKTSPR